MHGSNCALPQSLEENTVKGRNRSGLSCLLFIEDTQEQGDLLRRYPHASGFLRAHQYSFALIFLDMCFMYASQILIQSEAKIASSLCRLFKTQ